MTQWALQITDAALPLACEWALHGAGRGGPARWREAILAIMEALAASEAFWEYARRPELSYNVSARCEAALGALEGLFPPRLKQLLAKVHAKAAAAALNLPRSTPTQFVSAAAKYVGNFVPLLGEEAREAVRKETD
jgi:hypothetical protein